jgi:hypothetical protein
MYGLGATETRESVNKNMGRGSWAVVEICLSACMMGCTRIGMTLHFESVDRYQWDGSAIRSLARTAGGEAC